MRKITEHVTNAFENGRNCNEGNSSTHDRSMFLHGHEIAKFDDRGQLMITNAGWQTSTTKERLNGLSGVNIHQKDFQWFLNGEKWDGQWVEVSPEKLP